MATVTGYTKAGTDAAIAAAVPAVPDATTTAKGVVELATNAETTAGTDATRAVTPAGLKVVADTKVNAADAVALATAASGQDPTAPGTAAVGSQAVAARADHVHPSAGMYWWLGEGTADLIFDGTSAVTYPSPAGGTATFTPSAGVYTLDQGIVSARHITVASGATVKVNGAALYATGVATINGQLSANGSAAPGAVGGAGHPSSFYLAGGGNGATGGTGAGATGGAPNSAGRNRVAGVGGTGGASGATAGGVGGNLSGDIGSDGQAATQTLHPLVRTSAMYLSNPGGHVGPGGGGGAGAGDGTNAGGGGGGGGGAILLNCRKLAGAGSITANGGNGAAGTGGNAGGGGPGGGGFVFVNTADKSTWTGTVTANGGTPGAGAGTGAAGTVGMAGVANSHGIARIALYA